MGLTAFVVVAVTGISGISISIGSSSCSSGIGVVVNASCCYKRSVVFGTNGVFFNCKDALRAVCIRLFAFAEPMTLFHEYMFAARFAQTLKPSWIVSTGRALSALTDK